MKLELAKTYGFADMNTQRIKLFNELYEAGQLPEEERIELARAFIDERKPEAALDILEPYGLWINCRVLRGFCWLLPCSRQGRELKHLLFIKDLEKSIVGMMIFLARLGAEAMFNNFDTDAYDLFKAALKVNKDNYTALKGIGIILGEREEYRRAVAKFRHYNRLVPDDAEARYQLGEIYRVMGREADAVKEFRRAERIIRKKGKKDIIKR